MATINLNVNSNDVININVVNANAERKPTQGEVNALHNKLRSELVNKSNNAKQHFWYEVFIDFSEDFEEVLFPLIKDLPYEAAFDLCWGYLQRRDDYYGSDQYTNDLDEMYKNVKFH